MTQPALDPHTELATLLRPAGGGVYVVSTGLAEQRALQERLYGVKSETEIDAKFRAAIGQIANARAFILGVPSDVGAGYVRGANLGPQAIRSTLLDEDPAWPARLARDGIVDLGDVFVVPQLLHDSMLEPAQIDASRKAIYPNLEPEMRATLPVSPLSIAERAVELVLQINPRARPIALGGDHSTAWPIVASLAKVQQRPWGIVQIDAHTDLLAERLGVRYCFATWSFHANDLLGRQGRLTQVGIRATRHERVYWESTLGVRQFWAKECRADPRAALDAIVEHVASSGVEAIYFSNDIDGTDIAWAEATGTPEPDGLHPDFVCELIDRLSARVSILGGDVMEVAPPLERTPGGRARTLALATRYLRKTIDAIVATET